jgi:hypothetical protein
VEVEEIEAELQATSGCSRRPPALGLVGGHGGSDGHARGEEKQRKGERAGRWSG